MTRESSEESAQHGMLPADYTLSDDELRQMQTQHGEREKEVPAPDLGSRAPISIILLGGGLLLSAIAALFGAGSLVFALVLASTGLGDFSYMVLPWLFGVGLALVISVLGITGLVVCIRRVRMQRERILGRRLALFLGGGLFLVVLLAGIAVAWASKPEPLKHYEGAPYESPHATAPTPGPTKMPLAMPTPGGPPPRPGPWHRTPRTRLDHLCGGRWAGGRQCLRRRGGA